MTASHRIVPIHSEEDILPAWLGTPVGDLIRYHNLGRSPKGYNSAELLIGMCMDNRKRLNIPDNFAFILRSGGANLRRVEFKVSYAIAVGGVKAVTLIGHDDCGMVGLPARREDFIRGLAGRAGWTTAAAAEHFDAHMAEFEIGNSADFVLQEAERLGKRYPGIPVAPLYYSVSDGMLHHVVGI